MSGGQGRDSMDCYVGEVHMGYMTSKVLHYNVGYMKALADTEESTYFVGVWDS